MINLAINISVPTAGSSNQTRRAVDLHLTDPGRNCIWQVVITLPTDWAALYRGISGAFDPTLGGATLLSSSGETIVAFPGLDAEEVADRIDQSEDWLPLPPAGVTWEWDDDDIYISVARSDAEAFVFSARLSELLAIDPEAKSAALEEPGVIEIGQFKGQWSRFPLGEFVDVWSDLCSQVARKR